MCLSMRRMSVVSQLVDQWSFGERKRGEAGFVGLIIGRRLSG